MALLPICLWPNPVLKEESKEVTEFGADLHELLADMTETMWLEDGVGLAAPQVGILKRVFIATEMQLGKAVAFEVINPQILEKEGLEAMDEGCLSLEGMTFSSAPRATEIEVAYQDRHGNSVRKVLIGFEARAFQHEMDHLDGVLLIDKLLQKHPEPYRRDRWAKQIREAYVQKSFRSGINTRFQKAK